MNENLESPVKKKWIRWLHENAPAITGVSTILLVVVGAFGLYYVVGELSELRKQNSYLESSLKQTYRPLGYARHDVDDPTKIVVDMLFEKDALDRFSLKMDYNIYNHGQGVLCFIGYFYLAMTKPIEFRRQLIDGILDSVNVDSRFPYARRETILPFYKSNVSKVDATVVFERLPFSEKYFVYTLFFYEDQDGNLYDTEHLDVIPFEKPRTQGSHVEVSLDKTKAGFPRETYHAYSIEEKAKLVKAIRNLRYPKEHPIADFIEGLE